MCQLRNASTTIWIGTLSDWHIATLLTYKSHQILNQAETDRRATAIQEWQPVFREGEVANNCCRGQNHEKPGQYRINFTSANHRC